MWTFVESCARGLLPVAECSPVFQFAGIVVFLLISIATLAWLVLQRLASEPIEGLPARPHPTR
jgi:hypothetical protein